MQSATLEAAGSSTRDSGWGPSGPGYSLWERRVDQSGQARPEEAQEPCSGTGEGALRRAGRQEGLVVRCGHVRLRGHEHARRVYVVSLCELHEAVDREAASVEGVHHASLKEQHHRHRGDAEAPAWPQGGGIGNSVSVAGSSTREAVTGHPVDRALPVGAGRRALPGVSGGGAGAELGHCQEGRL